MLGWLHQLDGQLRAFLPLATGLVAVLVDAQPLPSPGFESVDSFSTLCVVYFWSLYRPDLFTIPTTFLIGLVYDALAGLPLGVTPLTLLLVRNLLVTQQRFFLARSFPVVWACFILLAPAALLFRWLLVSLWWGTLFPLAPVLVELLLTLALYPLASWLLGRLHAGIPRVIHAP
jgi:rod shape-determining protein MreD